MFARRLGRSALAVTIAAASWASTSCFFVKAGDRDECDEALDRICGCATRPCELGNPPPIVAAMRRCDPSDVRPDDYEGNIHICISEEAGFCAVLDGLSRNDDSICTATCRTACSPQLVASCERRQYEGCDVSRGEGGQGGQGGGPG
jgi:hypothetical protein